MKKNRGVRKAAPVFYFENAVFLVVLFSINLKFFMI